MLLHRYILFLSFFLLISFPAEGEEAGGYLAIWPLVDYRYSPEVDYTSLHFLGPLIKYEKKTMEKEVAVRPFFYRAVDAQGVSFNDFFYPVASLKEDHDRTTFQLLKLFNYNFGLEDRGSASEFTVFPFVYYGRSEKTGNYFAVFPVGGKILGRFWRDEIHFTLFPLYAATVKGNTTTTNILWPFLSRIRGENESGVSFWPFWGSSEKTGVYRKKFCLWPFLFSQDLDLDGSSPTRLRAVFPFYVSEESPEISSKTVLWPFFRNMVDHARNYEEWDFPMPFLRISRGEYKHGNRLLPFYADESVGGKRKRWFFWPIYKIEETRTEILELRRDRILFFLYSDLEERLVSEAAPYKKRVAIWPLCSYQRIKNVSRFHLLSLLEPFFPENPALERNWSPLWRLYQRKWDTSGNSVSTLLWNLYWKERRGEDVAMEIFPLFTYLRERERGTDLKLLKGVFRYRRDEQGSRINLLYLPWSWSWRDGAPPSVH